MYLRLGLGDSLHLYIDGFNCIHKHCPTRTGSGVALQNYSTKLNQTTCKHWLSVDYVLIPILQNFYLSRSLNLRRKTSLLASSTGHQTKELMTFYKKKIMSCLRKSLGKTKYALLWVISIWIWFLNFQQHQATGKFLDVFLFKYVFPMISQPACE